MRYMYSTHVSCLTWECSRYGFSQEHACGWRASTALCSARRVQIRASRDGSGVVEPVQGLHRGLTGWSVRAVRRRGPGTCTTALNAVSTQLTVCRDGALPGQAQRYCERNGWKQQVRCVTTSSEFNQSYVDHDSSGYLTYIACPVVPGDFMGFVRFEVRRCDSPSNAHRLRSQCRGARICETCVMLRRLAAALDAAVLHRLLLLGEQAEEEEPAHSAVPHGLVSVNQSERGQRRVAKRACQSLYYTFEFRLDLRFHLSHQSPRTHTYIQL